MPRREQLIQLAVSGRLELGVLLLKILTPAIQFFFFSDLFSVSYTMSLFCSKVSLSKIINSFLANALAEVVIFSFLGDSPKTSVFNIWEILNIIFLRCLSLWLDAPYFIQCTLQNL